MIMYRPMKQSDIRWDETNTHDYKLFLDVLIFSFKENRAYLQLAFRIFFICTLCNFNISPTFANTFYRQACFEKSIQWDELQLLTRLMRMALIAIDHPHGRGGGIPHRRRTTHGADDAVCHSDPGIA